MVKVSKLEAVHLNCSASIAVDKRVLARGCSKTKGFLSPPASFPKEKDVVSQNMYGP